MLVELRFREVFFCVSVYAYEWRRPASDGRKINAQVLSYSHLTLTLTLTLVAAARVSRQKDQRTGSVIQSINPNPNPSGGGPRLTAERSTHRFCYVIQSLLI